MLSGAIAQSVVRPNCVVVDAPFLDHDFGLPAGVEHLAIEQFVVEPGIEAFAVSGFHGQPSSM